MSEVFMKFHKLNTTNLLRRFLLFWSMNRWSIIIWSPTIGHNTLYTWVVFFSISIKLRKSYYSKRRKHANGFEKKCYSTWESNLFSLNILYKRFDISSLYLIYRVKIFFWKWNRLITCILISRLQWKIYTTIVWLGTLLLYIIVFTQYRLGQVKLQSL